jgi:hypothetical protein
MSVSLPAQSKKCQVQFEISSRSRQVPGLKLAEGNNLPVVCLAFALYGMDAIPGSGQYGRSYSITASSREKNSQLLPATFHRITSLNITRSDKLGLG